MINPEEIRANFMFRNSLQNSAVTLRRNIVENKKLGKFIYTVVGKKLK